MALISDLVSAIAEVEGIPEATVNLVARYAREAGHLSQGARGRNAPRATVADCANLLIAVNASGCVVKDAPKVVKAFRGLVCHAPHGSRTPAGLGVAYTEIDHDELRFLDRHGEATFGEILESVIDRFIGGELEMFMKGEAVKYLHEQYFEKAAKDIGPDPKALAARVGEACNRFLWLGTVAFTIEFHRPNPFVRIVVDRAIGAERELLAGASFMARTEDVMTGRVKPADGDRFERTSIGYRTLKKIAEVMRAPHREDDSK